MRDHKDQGDSIETLLKSWDEAAREERSQWRSKPRLHTAIFEEYREGAHTARVDDSVFSSPESAAAFRRRQADMTAEIDRITKLVGGDQRFEELTELVLAFREKPTIEKYASIREGFPELDIQVSLSGGIDPLFAIEKELNQYGIPPDLVAGAMDGFEPDIDQLCLLLIDRVVARDRIEGPGATQRRRQTVSDAMVNYLIAFMLEGADWADAEIRMPASLILLIRHQLGALRGDLQEEYKSRELKFNVALYAGEQLAAGEKLTINRLLKLSERVPEFAVSRSTAARWLKDDEFKNHVQFSRDCKASPEKFRLGSLAKKNVRNSR